MFFDLSKYCGVASNDLFIVTAEVDSAVMMPLMILKIVFLPGIVLDFVAVVESCPLLSGFHSCLDCNSVDVPKGMVWVIETRKNKTITIKVRRSKGFKKKIHTDIEILDYSCSWTDMCSTQQRVNSLTVV